jgi:hypothetical protein
VALPAFAETEDGAFLSTLEGRVFRIGRAYYLLAGARWFRLVRARRHSTYDPFLNDAWVPSPGPRAASVGFELRGGAPLRLVVDNTPRTR